MLRYGAFGHTHALCDFRARHRFHAPQQHDFTASRRKPVQRGLQLTQFIARDDNALRPRRIDRNVERFEISGRFDRNDIALPYAIYQKVARGREKKLFRPFGIFLPRGFIDADINFLAQIGNVARIAPIVMEIFEKDRLKRQYFGREPFVHRQSLQTCIGEPLFGVFGTEL